MRPEMLEHAVPVSDSADERMGRNRRNKTASYISGSFFTSMTAAMGMPKFDAGPQKSVFPSSNVSFPPYLLEACEV